MTASPQERILYRRGIAVRVTLAYDRVSHLSRKFLSHLPVDGGGVNGISRLNGPAGQIFLKHTDTGSFRISEKSLNAPFHSLLPDDAWSSRSQRIYREGQEQLWYDTRRVIVQFNTTDKAAQKRVLEDKSVERYALFSNPFKLYTLLLHSTSDTIGVATRLHCDPAVTFCEPDFGEFFDVEESIAVQRNTVTGTSCDWHLHRTRVNELKSTLAKPTATAVKMAVVDQGFNDHLCLRDNTDTDSSAYVKRTKEGYQIIGGKPFIGAKDHGTACAGMVGATPRKKVKFSGVAPACRLTLLTAYYGRYPTQASMAKAFLYALGEVEDASSLQDDRCVDIISCSAAPANAANLKLWSVMGLVLNYAKNCARGSRGVPIFWAVAHRTGHSVGCDEIATADGVVAVGATDAENRVRGSVSGPALDLVAPGIDVAVLKGTDTFHYTHGTSYATPLVAGIAARLLEIRPDLTASQIVDTLRLTANKCVGECVSFDERGHHDRYGHGIVDAWDAVKCVRLGL